MSEGYNRPDIQPPVPLLPQGQARVGKPPPDTAVAMGEAPSKYRLTVIEQVAHQGPDGEPIVTARAWGRWLTTSEQPLVRPCTIGEAWEPLPTFWLKDASAVHIVNRGKGESKVLSVGVCNPDGGPDAAIWGFALVRPGETMRWEPEDLAGVRVRCAGGPCEVTVTLVPG